MVVNINSNRKKRNRGKSNRDKLAMGIMGGGIISIVASWFSVRFPESFLHLLVVWIIGWGLYFFFKKNLLKTLVIFLLKTPMKFSERKLPTFLQNLVKVVYVSLLLVSFFFIVEKTPGVIKWGNEVLTRVEQEIVSKGSKNESKVQGIVELPVQTDSVEVDSAQADSLLTEVKEFQKQFLKVKKNRWEGFASLREGMSALKDSAIAQRKRINP